MKKRHFLLVLILLFGFVFLTACKETPSTPSEPQMSEEEKAAREVLDAIPVEDLHITYDGFEHHIRESKFDYPKSGNVSYSSYDKFTEPGTYPYTVKFGYQGFFREVTVNLVIEKAKPVYTGPTTVRVFLDERDDFDVSFNMEGVELTNPIHLTEVGDYTITLTTKENNIVQSIDPVEVNVMVREKHFVYSFESKTVIANGEAQTITLTEINDPLNTELFDITYSGNEGNIEQGIYHIKATLVEKSNGQVYDEYRAILTIDNPRNEEFDTYANEMFEYFVADDQITINILIGDYTQFGFEHQDAKWYSFEPYSDEDYQHDVEEVASLRTEFDAFKDAKLSYSQLIDYNLINQKILEYERLFADKSYLLMGLSYVDQYGGYAADLPSEIEGFHLKNKEDVEDMIDLLESVYPAFMSYYDYIVDREENGYPLNEYTLTNFIEYLKGVCDVFERENDTYYLINILNGDIRTNGIQIGLTLEEISEYTAEITRLFNEDYYNAHKDLMEKTQLYLDNALAEGGYLTDPDFDDRYLGQYEGGADLYFIRLQNKLGRYNMTPQEYSDAIDKWFKVYYRQWGDIKLSSTANNISNGRVKIVEDTSFDSMLSFLKEFAATIAPALATDPQIDVAWMDPTVTENTTTAAYYMKSPLTSTENEYIHLNEKSLGSNYLDTISTLAHEGYPGHLYAFVNVKENQNVSPFATISTNTTHGEGWATYVEVELHNYIAKIKNDPDWTAAMDYSNAYDFMSFLLYSKCDYVVNYEKADVAGLKKAIGKMGLSFGNEDAYESLFHTFNENPATYPAYGYGKAYFWQIHEDAKKALGENYDVIDFNRMVLEHGWCSIDSLEGYYNQYMSDQLFLAGLGE